MSEVEWSGITGSTVMVADDDHGNRLLTSETLLSAGYKVVTASDGLEALHVLEDESVDVILLDVMMPLLNGYETCRRIKNHPRWRLLPVVMLTALSDVGSRVKALEAGADDFLSKPVNISELLARVKTSARTKQLNEQLENTEGILFALADVVEAKDKYTDQHLKRMARYVDRLARLAGFSFADQQVVRFGGILHDIGKVGISDSILCKPGKLTPEEYEIMKGHTILGARIIGPMRFGRKVGPIVRGHHERWDGGGYPDGLAGEAIPVGARIVAVADTFDAMTSDRPYRKALPDEEAILEMSRIAGTQLDPTLVELFISNRSEMRLDEPSPPGRAPSESLQL